MEGLILFIVAMLVYFLPLGMAMQRKHRNTLAIGMVNLLLGWTVICWLWALIWACTANTKGNQPKVVYVQADGRTDINEDGQQMPYDVFDPPPYPKTRKIDLIG